MVGAFYFKELKKCKCDRCGENRVCSIQDEAGKKDNDQKYIPKETH